MVIYDLLCDSGHAFEGWFDSPEDFASQCQRELVECPSCGSLAVVRRPHASALARRSSAAESIEAATGLAGQHARLREALHQAAAAIRAQAEDVGERFADEARKIHRGDVEPRSILGTATDREETALRDEGVPFVKIPMPKHDA